MKINVKGVIVSDDVKWIYDLFGISAVSPKDIAAQIEAANGEDLEVEINSGGGDVFAGSEIYTALHDHKGGVSVKIMGIAASAAGVVAMAGKTKVEISPTAQFMLHNASSVARGDYRDMEHAAEFLKNWNTSIANAYMLKTGMTRDELLGLMDQETWLNAQQAVKYGFADEVMFDEGAKLVASHSDAAMLPQEVINKIRNSVGTGDGLEKFLSSTLKPQVEPVNNQKGSEKPLEIKNVEELRAQYPDLCNQLETDVRAQAHTDERKRIQAIDDISATVDPALVAKAKYEQPITAQELAFEALKADAAKGQKYQATREQELEDSKTKEVPAGSETTPLTAEQEAAAVDKIAASANKKRGAK